MTQDASPLPPDPSLSAHRPAEEISPAPLDPVGDADAAPPIDREDFPEAEGDLASLEPADQTGPSSTMPAREVTPAEIVAGNWEPNLRARALSVELRRIEFEIRGLLGDADIKRKRKYEGTRRWMELLEDIIQMRHAGPAGEDVLKRVTERVAKRQQLFRELNFVVATRHCWNT